jgi:hypothetical protein
VYEREIPEDTIGAAEAIADMVFRWHPEYDYADGELLLYA